MTDVLPPDLFDDCDREVPIQVGDKWTARIITCLRDRPRRFGELLVPLHPITAKVLTESLRRLERDGMVDRSAYDENPPRVEYALTELGRSLFEPLEASCEWNRRHGEAYRSVRAAAAST
ncbi:winged helix-turn-helix transcriptional regulator [Solicola gregarius]|uniref:Helix-turn-helix transcriptional regulator n=1 Tax=Solicola gregarius TaxID=2908642 RepID=A0AA46TJ45_9ACTN|nr:helix-turn-helix domain-containing protein [Solicola gregarius]UYM06256.1 helix-turn-helix transcriptional regulator [Solicola gregarius]